MVGTRRAVAHHEQKVRTMVPAFATQHAAFDRQVNNTRMPCGRSLGLLLDLGSSAASARLASRGTHETRAREAQGGGGLVRTRRTLGGSLRL